jgi:hypothetical protein
MAANGILVRPLPSPSRGWLSRGRQLFVVAGAVIAADLLVALFITHEQGQTARALGAAAGIAVVVWFAMGTRSALVAFAGWWGFLHSFLFSTSLGGSAGGQSLNLSRALGGAIVVGVGLALLRLRRSSVRLPAELVAILLFLGLYVCDVAISPLKSLGAGDAGRVASGVFVGIAAFWLFDTRDRLVQVSRAAFLGGVAVAAMTVIQYAVVKVSPGAAHSIFGANAFVYSADQSHSNHVARVSGSLGAPGETSGFLVVTASFGVLYYALLRETARRRGIVAGIALMGLAIASTLTRASTGAFLLLIVIWMIQRQLRSVSAAGMRMKILTGVLICVVLAVPVLGAKTLHTRLWDINPSSSGTGFAQGRGAIWHSEAVRLKASSVPQLLLGHGAHTSELQGYFNGAATETSPHNLLVWLIIETGVIGTALYIAFLIGAGMRYRAATRWGRYEYAGQVGAVGLAGLIAYQVQGMFLLSPTSPGHGIYFMLFIGATLRACTAAPTRWRAASAEID